MKKNSGITLVSLILTILIMLLVTGTVVYNSTSKIGISKLEKMYIDIENLREQIMLYYSKYQALPITGEALTNSQISQIPNEQINSQDNLSEYYVIDLSKMNNLSLNYGKGFNNYPQELNDIYIINAKTQIIYYLDGIEYEGQRYYTKSIEYEYVAEEDYFANFITQWTVTNDDLTIVLPIFYQEGYSYNFIVDYGDGVEARVISYDDVDKIHTYSEPGTYTVKIKGRCDGFSFLQIADSKLNITKLIQWGKIGVKTINFVGCKNLTGTIPRPQNESFINVTNFTRLFDECDGLSGKIPENLFDNCPNVNSYQGIFAKCTGLTGNAIALWERENVVGLECYKDCIKLNNYNEIPQDWK